MLDMVQFPEKGMVIIMNSEELISFFGSDQEILEKSGISHDDISFAVKLHLNDIHKRKLQTEQKKISLNTIKSIFKTIINNNYLICLRDGKCVIISSDTENPRVDSSMKDLDFELTLIPTALNCTIKIKVPTCPIESVSFSYGPADSILGKVSELFRLFGAKSSQYNILKASEEGYYKVSVFRQNAYDTLDAFSFIIENTADTLLTIGSESLCFHNMDALLNYSSIVSYSFNQNIYSIVTLEEDTLKLYSISAIPSGSGKNPLDNSCFEDIYKLNNLVFRQEEPFVSTDSKLLSLPLNTDKLAVHNLFTIFFESDLEKYLFVISDNILRIGHDQNALQRFSLFYYQDKMYIQNAENELIVLQPPEKVKSGFMALNMDFNEYFLDFNRPQYLLESGSGTAKKAQLYDDKLVFGEESILFRDFDKVNFNPDCGCAMVTMINGSTARSFVCAFDYAFSIWQKFERSNLSKLKLMTFNEIQSYLNNLVINRFLYAVFGEIIITNEEINDDISLTDLLEMIAQKDGSTLRTMGDSLLTKFKIKSIDDLQEIMLRKVSSIEYHKNRILILANEWNLIYPHYMGMREYKHTIQLFNSDLISPYELEKDRLDVVENIRKIVQNVNSSISAILGNIDKSISKISSLIPPQISADTSTYASRLTSSSLAFQSGTVTTGFKFITQLSDAVAKGIILSDMPSLVFSPVSNILSHFAKDSQERKDLKVYGNQVLEWWEMIMKYLTFLIVEARQMFGEFVQSRGTLYAKYMENMSENEKTAFIEKYFSIIEDEIKAIVEEKFHAVAAKKFYLQTIVDKIEELEKHYADYIDDFATKKL
jgi:hypothetical protein